MALRLNRGAHEMLRRDDVQDQTCICVSLFLYTSTATTKDAFIECKEGTNRIRALFRKWETTLRHNTKDSRSQSHIHCGKWWPFRMTNGKSASVLCALTISDFVIGQPQMRHINSSANRIRCPVLSSNVYPKYEINKFFLAVSTQMLWMTVILSLD